MELAGRSRSSRTRGSRYGLWDSTEHAAVATALLVDSGLNVGKSLLCVLDGTKAMRKAVCDVLGVATPAQRCSRYIERNVCSLKTTLCSTDDRVSPPQHPPRHRWQSGETALGWTAAGMLEAERQFRKVIGYRDLVKLAAAVETTSTVTVSPITLTPTRAAALVATV